MAEYNQDPNAQEEFNKWLDSRVMGIAGSNSKTGWWNNHNLNNLFSSETPSFNVSGSAKEQAGRIDGLQRAKILTGQNPYEIGKDYQEAYGNIKKRTQMSDTGSELLRANKAGAVADTRNQMQQQGVKGGAAAGAVAAVERAKAYDVNNQLQQSQRQAEMDYMNAVKSNANFTTSNEMNYGALATGGQVKAPSNNSGGMSTVICTELHSQGIMSDELYLADCEYGKDLEANSYPTLLGYRFLASPVVSLMKKSKLVTKVVASVAMPWANNMAGKPNTLGSLVSNLGEPLCWVVGKILILWRTL